MPPNQLGSGNQPRLRDRLVVFFATNPDESLHLTDIATKFGVDRSTAQQCVLHMRAAGLVEGKQARAAAPLEVKAGPALLGMLGSHE